MHLLCAEAFLVLQEQHTVAAWEFLVNSEVFVKASFSVSLNVVD